MQNVSLLTFFRNPLCQHSSAALNAEFKYLSVSRMVSKLSKSYNKGQLKGH